MVLRSPRAFPVCRYSLLLSSFLFFPAWAVDPGYLETVEADVAEFTSQEFQPPADSTWLGGGEQEASPALDLAGFASYLQDKSPGSYIFYMKLSFDYQERLHKDYLATGDLDRIKEDIFKYTREMKK
ncbi:MAG: hypothetical protein P8166_18525 [Candidatus Thiodiazotropha sp.]